MNDAKRKIKFIDRLIHNEFIDSEDKCFLLEIKKDIQYGKLVNNDNFLNHIQLNSFYDQYENDISRWLAEPLDSIRLRIKNSNFTVIENKLILTNILIKFRREKENAEIS